MLVIQIRQIRRRQECGDFRADRERRIAGIFLPAILRAYRAVPRQIARGLPTIGQNRATSASANAPSRRAKSTSRIGKAVSSIWIPSQ